MRRASTTCSPSYRRQRVGRRLALASGFRPLRRLPDVGRHGDACPVSLAPFAYLEHGDVMVSRCRKWEDGSEVNSLAPARSCAAAGRTWPRRGLPAPGEPPELEIHKGLATPTRAQALGATSSRVFRATTATTTRCWAGAASRSRCIRRIQQMAAPAMTVELEKGEYSLRHGDQLPLRRGPCEAPTTRDLQDRRKRSPRRQGDHVHDSRGSTACEGAELVPHPLLAGARGRHQRLRRRRPAVRALPGRPDHLHEG